MKDLYVKVYSQLQDKLDDELEFYSEDEQREIQIREAKTALDEALSLPVVLEFIQELTAQAVELGAKLLPEKN